MTVRMAVKSKKFEVRINSDQEKEKAWTVMDKQKNSINVRLEKLLHTPASKDERALLKSLGFTSAKADKLTVILAALYKKCAAGDLSAFKELRSLLCAQAEDVSGGAAVIIVDNIKN